VTHATGTAAGTAPSAAPPDAAPVVAESAESRAPSAPPRTAESARDARTTAAHDVRARTTEARLSAPSTRVGDASHTHFSSPEVDAARSHAAELQDTTLPWGRTEADRAAILEHVTQIDSDRGAARGGDDVTRCGAAAITGGLVVAGPERLAAARATLEERVGRLSDHTPSGMWSAPGLTDARRDLATAQRLLDGLPEDPRTWTYSQLEHFQQAIYSSAHAEDALLASRTSRLATAGDGLATDTVGRYRDMLWGDGYRPSLGGHGLDVVAMPGEPMGHAGLAHSGTNEIVYDSWPDETGRARSRPTDEGSSYRYTSNSTYAPTTAMPVNREPEFARDVPPGAPPLGEAELPFGRVPHTRPADRTAVDDVLFPDDALERISRG